MGGSQQSRSPSDRRHNAAVRNSLTAADAAADRGDLADALAWVDMVLVVDGHLPPAYAAKRVRWALAVDAAR